MRHSHRRPQVVLTPEDYEQIARETRSAQGRRPSISKK